MLAIIFLVPCSYLCMEHTISEQEFKSSLDAIEIRN